ncbi:MAG: hypothetical protein RSD47_10995 [Romboutsia sp.]
MNLQSKNNAKQALNDFKLEIISELHYNCNSINNRIETNHQQEILEVTNKR